MNQFNTLSVNQSVTLKTRLRGAARLLSLAALAALPLHAAAADSDSTEVTINSVSTDGVGDSMGTVTFSNSEYGLVVTPKLKGLTPGAHGFHIHVNPDCSAKMKDGELTPAAAAGGHYDPKSTEQHKAPWEDGHLGDMPTLVVDAEGKASQPVLVPRLSVEDIKGRSVMIHQDGDNYSDDPKPLGGGGARVACGVISS
jgi:Cu-Zn family superoxide dismutase